MELFECGICLAVCRDPVVASCGAHTFCKEHLQHWIRQSAAPCCPICRAPQRQGADEVQVNVMLRDAIAALRAPSLAELTHTDVEVGAERLGAGGMGEVFAARWQGSEVAVKRLHARDASQAARRGFKKEMEVMSKLQHPNVVRVYGVCLPSTDSPLMVMERALRSLSDAIPRPGGLELGDSLRFGLGIARGLLYLHTREPSISHCDLKPANVLLSQDGVPKIADFGIAHIAVSTGLTTAADMRGTINYTAPENFDIQAAGYAEPPCDIYSFACVLLEMFLGTPPWEGLPMMPIFTQVSRGQRPVLPPHLARDVADLISACWQQSPGDRPSANAVIDRLMLLEDDRMPPPPDQSRPELTGLQAEMVQLREEVARLRAAQPAGLEGEMAQLRQQHQAQQQQLRQQQQQYEQQLQQLRQELGQMRVTTNQQPAG
eukprot:Hpha_TRINITY_DN15626_c3_g2::TRINITY_DN15626_c3_g2_i1::g.100203::m.100203/K04424/ZAK, MLTK; sterile alpha motif and leucine zipper containing kinase AZK